jgi:transcriptional regulator with XRE-family HTH domain
MPLEDMGRLILEKRNERGLGIRAAAREVGISHATLARVEKGFLPDVENFEKIRRWLGIQEDNVMTKTGNVSIPQVHFRREKTATPATAAALARMILAAQAAWPKDNK